MIRKVTIPKNAMARLKLQLKTAESNAEKKELKILIKNLQIKRRSKK